MENFAFQRRSEACRIPSLPSKNRLFPINFPFRDDEIDSKPKMCVILLEGEGKADSAKILRKTFNKLKESLVQQSIDMIHEQPKEENAFK